MGALAAGLLLSACAGALQSLGGPAASATGGTEPAGGTPAAAGTQAAAAKAGTAAPVSVGQRDLSAEEKKVIVDAVAPNLKDASAAKYYWTKVPAVTTDDTANYCSIVNGKSPYPPYNGRQAYIVETKLMGGRITAATMGLIAGGKDAALVAKMCAKYGLDPDKAH
jgi:hypothetical protein